MHTQCLSNLLWAYLEHTHTHTHTQCLYNLLWAYFRTHTHTHTHTHTQERKKERGAGFFCLFFRPMKIGLLVHSHNVIRANHEPLIGKFIRKFWLGPISGLWLEKNNNFISLPSLALPYYIQKSEERAGTPQSASSTWMSCHPGGRSGSRASSMDMTAPISWRTVGSCSPISSRWCCTIQRWTSWNRWAKATCTGVGLLATTRRLRGFPSSPPSSPGRLGGLPGGGPPNDPEADVEALLMILLVPRTKIKHVWRDENRMQKWRRPRSFLGGPQTQ